MDGFSKELITPCGMNCGICLGFFGYTMSGKKRKNKCIGFNPSGKSCSHLKKFCEKLPKKEIEYCYECKDFPCIYLVNLDKKYQKRFNMSMIENLIVIKKQGMNFFLKEQEKKYKCSEFDGIICGHNSKCYSCDTQIKDIFFFN